MICAVVTLLRAWMAVGIHSEPVAARTRHIATPNRKISTTSRSTTSGGSGSRRNAGRWATANRPLDTSTATAPP
jgi:hypothetical protein